LNFLVKSSVKALVLSGNNLTDVCLDAFLNFVTMNNVLKNVYLPKNYINILKSKAKINLLKDKGLNIYIWYFIWYFHLENFILLDQEDVKLNIRFVNYLFGLVLLRIYFYPILFIFTFSDDFLQILKFNYFNEPIFWLCKLFYFSYFKFSYFFVLLYFSFDKTLKLWRFLFILII